MTVGKVGAVISDAQATVRLPSAGREKSSLSIVYVNVHVFVCPAQSVYVYVYAAEPSQVILLKFGDVVNVAEEDMSRPQASLTVGITLGVSVCGATISPTHPTVLALVPPEMVIVLPTDAIIVIGVASAVQPCASCTCKFI